MPGKPPFILITKNRKIFIHGVLAIFGQLARYYTFIKVHKFWQRAEWLIIKVNIWLEAEAETEYHYHRLLFWDTRVNLKFYHKINIIATLYSIFYTQILTYWYSIGKKIYSVGKISCQLLWRLTILYNCSNKEMLTFSQGHWKSKVVWGLLCQHEALLNVALKLLSFPFP